jgi:hypothetical protein
LKKRLAEQEERVRVLESLNHEEPIRKLESLHVPGAMYVMLPTVGLFKKLVLYVAIWNSSGKSMIFKNPTNWSNILIQQGCAEVCSRIGVWPVDER